MATVKMNSYDYNYEGVEKSINEALALIGGIEKYINPGEKVLITPNMLEGVPRELSVTPHPSVVL